MIRLGARSLMCLGFIAALMFAAPAIGAIPWSPQVLAWLGLIVSAAGVGWFALWVLGREMDEGIQGVNDEIDAARLVDYRCAVNGHEYGHPVWLDNNRAYECKVCGNRVLSGPGWVA